MSSKSNCMICVTCLTKYWQKAGAIHSLAWMPQSIQMAFFLAPVFTPIWRTNYLPSIAIFHIYICKYTIYVFFIPWVGWWFSFRRSFHSPWWSQHQSGPFESAPSSHWSEISGIVNSSLKYSCVFISSMCVLRTYCHPPPPWDGIWSSHTLRCCTKKKKNWNDILCKLNPSRGKQLKRNDLWITL